MTEVQVVPANELTDRDIAAWSDIQQAIPELDSPFFRPELTQVVAQSRGDVEVALLGGRREPLGFFPFQRGKANTAQAVVGRLSEFHGVVARPDLDWNADDVMRRCGLRAWYFDHVPGVQRQFQAHTWSESSSPYIDLSDGFEAYETEQRRAGSRAIAQVKRKSRKIEREVGRLRFRMHESCDAAFRSLLDWKTAQHQRTGVLQVLKVDWVRQLLDRIRKTTTPDFAGVFSALYVGDELAAAHLGLRGKHVLHMWFPVYNPAFEKYSPGLILLLKLAEAASRDGIRRIDLGKGRERYKGDLKSGDLPLLEGAVDRRHAVPIARRAWHQTKRWMRGCQWSRYLEPPLLATRRFRQWLAFR